MNHPDDIIAAYGGDIYLLAEAYVKLQDEVKSLRKYANGQNAFRSL